jgi:hypothetical protein
MIVKPRIKTPLADAYGVSRYRDEATGDVLPDWPGEVIRTHRVYFVRAGEHGPVKVGFTADLQTRLRALQTGCPATLRLECQIVGTRAIEALLHDWLSGFHVRGEWYRITADYIQHITIELLEKGLLWFNA